MSTKPKITGKADWHYKRVGREYGPITFGELRHHALEGRLHETNDFVKHASMKDWVKAGEVEGLIKNAAPIEAVAEWRKKSVSGHLPISSKLEKTNLSTFILCTLIGAAIYCGPYYFPKAVELSTNIEALLPKIGLGFIGVAYLAAIAIIYRAWKNIQPFDIKTPPILVAIVMLIPGVNILGSLIALPFWGMCAGKIRKSDKRLNALPRTPALLFLPACAALTILTAFVLLYRDKLTTPNVAICIGVFFVTWLLALSMMTRTHNKLISIRDAAKDIF